MPTDHTIHLDSEDSPIGEGVFFYETIEYRHYKCELNPYASEE